MIAKNKRLVLMFIVFTITLFFVVCGYASAPTTVRTIGDVAAQITQSMADLARLATAGAYVGGFGFAIAAILKFKAHKDNPTQIPVGTPIALLLIAVAMIFVPTIFGVTGRTLFGETTEVGGVSGITSFTR